MRTPDMFLSKQEREEKRRRLLEASLPPKMESKPESKPESKLESKLESKPKLPTRPLNTPAMFQKPSQRPCVFMPTIIHRERIKQSSVPQRHWRCLDFPVYPPALLYPSEPAFPSSPASISNPVALPQISFRGSYFSDALPLRSDAEAESAPSEPSEPIESVIDDLSVGVLVADERQSGDAALRLYALRFVRSGSARWCFHAYSTSELTNWLRGFELVSLSSEGKTGGKMGQRRRLDRRRLGEQRLSDLREPRQDLAGLRGGARAGLPRPGGQQRRPGARQRRLVAPGSHAEPRAPHPAGRRFAQRCLR